MPGGTVVLVHGAWHDRSCWGAVAAGLEVAGVEAVAIDLSLESIGADARIVREAVAAATGPVLLVGHSYGGMAITAGGHAASRLVFVTAFAPDEGESVGGLAAGSPTELDRHLVIEGSVAKLAPGALAALYGTSPEELAEEAMEHWRPTALECFGTPLTGPPAWRDVPCAYLVCLDDKAIDPDLQLRMARRTEGEITKLESDHSPFFSMPDVVADLLVAELEELAGS